MNKQEIANSILRRNNLAVHLDPQNLSARVPRQFRKQSHLRLDFGLNMPKPIPDLTVDENGIRGTLSFASDLFWCDVPWSTVFALVDEEGRGKVWPEDMPAAVTAELASEAKQASKPQLRLV